MPETRNGLRHAAHQSPRIPIDGTFALGHGFLVEGSKMHVEQIMTVVAGTARDIENWISRLDLSSGFEKPGRGRSRTFTLRNTMELALLAAFVRAGMEPSKALAHTRALVEPSLRLTCSEWYIIPAGDLNKAQGKKVIDLESLVAASESDPFPIYSLIRTGEIARRVLALFNGT